MHTVKITLPRESAADWEEKLLLVANDLGRPLNFSLLVMPTHALLTGYFKKREESLKQLKLLGLEGQVTHGYLRDRDWQDSVKKHFSPLIYRNVAWIPSWTKNFSKISSNKKIKTVIRLDIGMAFGTGNHPTTRLCLRRLVETLRDYQKPSVLDIGCGSGILAITADKLGASRAEGFDLDEHSIVVARRNARMNRSRAKLAVRDLYKTKLPKSDIVLANLLFDLIADNAKKLWTAVKPGGTLILSGLLKTQLGDIAKMFPAKARPTRLGQWGVLVIKKARNTK